MQERNGCKPNNLENVYEENLQNLKTTDYFFFRFLSLFRVVSLVRCGN